MSNINYTRLSLLKNYNPEDKGSWEIYGEDPNCDLGGSHHEPHLDTVFGTYKNVVEYALTLKGFFSWGSGGRIKKANETTRNVDKLFSAETIKLREERERLIKANEENLKRIADIDKELK